MKEKGFSVLAIVSAVLALVLAIGVGTVFAACGPKDDGTWMHCHDVQMAIIACGVVIAIVLAVAAFVKGTGAKAALFAVAIICCIVVLALPSVMPMCGMETMRCHAVMAPFARIMAGIVGILGIVNLVFALKEGKKDMPKYGTL